VHGLREDVGGVRGDQGDHRLQDRIRGAPADQPDDGREHGADDGATARQEDEVADGELPGDRARGHRNGHRDLEQHQRGGVVEQALGLDEDLHLPRQGEPSAQGGDRDRVGAGQHGAEDEGHRGGQRGDRDGEGADRRGRRQHEPEGEDGDGPPDRPQVAQGQLLGGGVQQWGQHDQRDGLRGDRRHGGTGDEGDQDSGQDEHRRRRDPQPAGERRHRRRQHDQEEDGTHRAHQRPPALARLPRRFAAFLPRADQTSRHTGVNPSACRTCRRACPP
jgi:hypothetical protein